MTHWTLSYTWEREGSPAADTLVDGVFEMSDKSSSLSISDDGFTGKGGEKGPWTIEKKRSLFSLLVYFVNRRSLELNINALKIDNPSLGITVHWQQFPRSSSFSLFFYLQFRWLRSIGPGEETWEEYRPR